MREEFKDDFTGFTYAGRHSSEFNITRVSESDRYIENLLPPIQDKTIQVPGGDGMYYFGSDYGDREFNVSYAFDNITEEIYLEMSNWLSNKGVYKLIFDEHPEKFWYAKVVSTSSMKFVCFDEGNQRIYKGEGSVNFKAIHPYAHSTNQFNNPSEIITMGSNTYHGWYVLNNGDMSIDYRIIIPYDFLQNLSGITIYNSYSKIVSINVENIYTALKANYHLVIDSKSGTFYETDENNIRTGKYFYIGLLEIKKIATGYRSVYLACTDLNGELITSTFYSNPEKLRLQYNYYYI